MTERAFYQQDGEFFAATEFTRGPWDPSLQHAGPPAALLARAASRASGGASRRIARITCEILRPIPVAPLRAAAEVVRPGGTVDLVDARLETADGTVVMLARAWRFPDQVADVPEGALPQDPVPPPPGHGSVEPFFPSVDYTGWHTAASWRFTRGSFVEPGPATVWMRTDAALVAGEALKPLTRVLVPADAGSGVSATLDPAEYLFLNVDLAVHLYRDPASDWIGFDAESAFSGTRTGLAHSDVYDQSGRIGHALQTLLVSPRRPGS